MSGYRCPKCKNFALAVEGRGDLFCQHCANSAPVVSGNTIEKTMPKEKVDEIIRATNEEIERAKAPALVPTEEKSTQTPSDSTTRTVAASEPTLRVRAPSAALGFGEAVQAALSNLRGAPMPPTPDAYSAVFNAIKLLEAVKDAH